MVLRVAFLLLSLLVYFWPAYESETLKFYLLTSLLLGFNFIMLRRVYLKQPAYFFISPVFLATIVTFGFIFGGVVNFFLLTDGQYSIKGFGYKIWSEREWLTKAMLISCIASLSTWIGFDMKIGSTLYLRFSRIKLYNRIYCSDVNVNRLLVFAVIAYLAKFYLFGIGLYGRIVSEEYFEGAVGFKAGSQIRILADLSYVTFFYISVLKFQRNSSLVSTLFYFSLVFELFFGFIYGARSAFITPFLIIFIAYYYVFQRWSYVSIILVLLSTYVAFTFVLDFKNFVLSKDFVRSESTIEVLSNFRERQTKYVSSSRERYQLKSALNSTLESISFVPETAVAIRQRDKLGMEMMTNPSIIATVLKFPFDAFVPRFLQGENEYPWGYWFKEEVVEVNRGLKYSIAMSPIGFLYMGGGVTLVIAGFILYGILLKFTYPFILRKNLFSALTYMLLVSVLYNLDSIYSNTLIYFLRYLFIYPVIIWVLFDARAFKVRK